jgi:pimeloyl-ACP methyl ester carboxylesterase
MCSRFRLILGRLLGILATILFAASVTAADAPLVFQLRFDKGVREQPFTGRVYVMLTRSETNQLPSGINYFKPEPVFARDVRDWKPGETITLDAGVLGFPYKLADLPRDTYSIHAVMDLDRGDRHFSTADGNIYSPPLRRELDPKTTGPVELVLNKVYKAPTFAESERVKLVDIESKLLSDFHNTPVRLRAGVVLPKSFATEPERRYPVLYVVPSFSGSHFGAIAAAARNPNDIAGVEMLYVVLDPSCRWGHHVFADSANNGPCGQALIAELVPHIEKEYRAIGEPTARLLTGHSSGGWSSLWLQVTYPDFFGGVWATAPDPVDFRDFQRINLYREGENMFTDAAGQPRPIARRGGQAVLWYRPFSDMEVVTGHGGQLPAFEACFSPRGADGKPRQLWDRTTGKIDRDVAKSWETYDIRLVLERNWKTLGPKLAGKIHVFMGKEDTFYLEGATALLKEALAKLASDAVVEIIPGKDHGSLLDKPLRDRIHKEMAATFRRTYSK